nr:GAF domain-containing sensor histidine kinase [Anaerolineae bacterium]
LDKVLEFCARHIPGHEASTIMLLDETQPHVSFATSRGYDDYHALFEGMRLPVTDMPITRKMLQDGQPVLVADTEHDPLWNTEMIVPWHIRSYLGAPIRLNDLIIGVINIDSYRPNAFTASDAPRLLTFAAKAAAAIQNARRAEDLERRVIERTRELTIRSAQIQAILRSTGEGILYSEGVRIIFVNQALCAMTGYSETELIDGNIRALLIPADFSAQEEELLLAIPALVSQGKIWRNELRLRRRDGSTFDAGVTLSRLDGSSTEDRIQAVSIVRDIRREKELEQQKTRFIASAAHELRSPITSLNNRLYFMQKDPQRIPEQMVLLEKVIRRMNRLVSDLLDLSYFEYGHIQAHNEAILLQDVLTEALEAQQPEAAAQNIDLTLHQPETPLPMVADPHRLLQVFTNLIGNALTYTPPGGTVQVLAEHAADRQQVIIRVQDSGPGIPPESLETIFLPFMRLSRDKPGTGLGLSIAREIVALHGGTIHAGNVSDSGAVFTVVLPVLLPD